MISIRLWGRGTREQDQVAAELFAARQPAPESLPPQFGDTVLVRGDLQDYHAEFVQDCGTGRALVYLFNPDWRGGCWYEQHVDTDRVSVLIPGGALTVWFLYAKEQVL